MNFWPVLVAAVKMKLNFFPPFSLQAFVKKNERRKPRSASYVNDGSRWNEVRDGPERVVPTQDFLLVERKLKFSVHPKPVKLFLSVLVLLLATNTDSAPGGRLKVKEGGFSWRSFFIFIIFERKSFVGWWSVGVGEKVADPERFKRVKFFFNFILIPRPFTYIFHTRFTHSRKMKRKVLCCQVWGGWRVNLTCASIIHMHGP